MALDVPSLVGGLTAVCNWMAPVRALGGTQEEQERPPRVVPTGGLGDRPRLDKCWSDKQAI